MVSRRILDVRIIRGRDDRMYTYVEGQRVQLPTTTRYADALRALADAIDAPRATTTDDAAARTIETMLD